MAAAVAVDSRDFVGMTMGTAAVALTMGTAAEAHSVGVNGAGKITWLGAITGSVCMDSV